ncbi:MAG: hypothetical protein Q4B26_20895, partial [Eubacteriales bacterium]|nr:hypothetical protein [Eubacteriales bacterium]
SSQTVGIIGPRDRVFYQLRSLIVEMTTQHNYRDVRLVGIFENGSLGNWGVLRWLPHIWDESGQVRYIAFDEKRRHIVSEMLSDTIKQRKAETSSDHSKEKKLQLPHYVIVIENQELLQDEAIYDDLVANNPDLGITTIILSESVYDLPQTCQYMINLTEQPYVFARESYDKRVYFKPDEPVHQVQLESFTRKMAAIEMKDKKAEASVPSAITFLQGYGVQTVEELDILGRWERSEPYKSLAAPLGMMAGGKTFDLDILDGDQAHGPHGLL